MACRSLPPSRPQRNALSLRTQSHPTKVGRSESCLRATSLSRRNASLQTLSGGSSAVTERARQTSTALRAPSGRSQRAWPGRVSVGYLGLQVAA
eukprot:363782-Chlamydomonas_euryale.AAC.1